jgi:hypothetical protein
MLLTPDGRPYKTVGDIRQFDPENQEHDLFNLWDEEIIRQGGSPLFYHEVFIQTGNVDQIYWEDRSKMFSNHPIQLYGFYEPVQSQMTMGIFGGDGTSEEVMFELNYRAVLRAIGHPPKIGSIIYSPHLRENWVIFERGLGEFKMYGTLRLQLKTQRFQDDVVTGKGNIPQKNPDFKII